MQSTQQLNFGVTFFEDMQHILTAANYVNKTSVSNQSYLATKMQITKTTNSKKVELIKACSVVTVDHQPFVVATVVATVVGSAVTLSVTFKVVVSDKLLVTTLSSTADDV